MNPKQIDVALQSREALIVEVRALEGKEGSLSTAYMVFSTGSIVRRIKWEGWDIKEYDEELISGGSWTQKSLKYLYVDFG